MLLDISSQGKVAWGYHGSFSLGGKIGWLAPWECSLGKDHSQGDSSLDLAHFSLKQH
jgi:hypothetical protein